MKRTLLIYNDTTVIRTNLDSYINSLIIAYYEHFMIIIDDRLSIWNKYFEKQGNILTQMISMMNYKILITHQYCICDEYFNVIPQFYIRRRYLVKKKNINLKIIEYKQYLLQIFIYIFSYNMYFSFYYFYLFLNQSRHQFVSDDGIPLKIIWINSKKNYFRYSENIIDSQERLIRFLIQTFIETQGS
ncbi:hypothetical protein pb186bvf_008863 [Paramecium bursaria]